ncbi:hypothetical protein ACHAWF_004191 [Thalassiosira exigua]
MNWGAMNVLWKAAVAIGMVAELASAEDAEDSARSSQVLAGATAFLRQKARSRKNAAAADLPFFGGREGEECRRAALEEWEEAEESQPYHSEYGKRENLRAIMETDLFQEARARCDLEVGAYDRAGGLVCLLEASSAEEEGLSYAQFWGGGAYFLDGAHDLATMFEYTGNFTLADGTTTCIADCYTGIGNGCTEEQTWLANAGSVPRERYCDMRWGEIDAAYYALKVCASKAIGVPADDTERVAWVGRYQSNQATNYECSYRYCHEMTN